MKFQSRLVVVVLALTLCTSCSTSVRNKPIQTRSRNGTSVAPTSADAEKRGHALLRVIGAIPTGVTFDVFVNDHLEFNRIAYKSVSPYKEVVGMSLALTVKLADVGKQQSLSTLKVFLEKGSHYTLVAMMGKDNQIELKSFEDEFVGPSTGWARLRLVNACSEPTEFDVRSSKNDSFLLNGKTTLASRFVDIRSQTLDLIVSSKEPGALLKIDDLNLESTKFYTIVVVGRRERFPILESFVLEDQVIESK